MTTLAAYVPKPQELIDSILLLGFAYAAFCLLATRYGLSLKIAAASIALGCVVALCPDLIVASRENVGRFGDYCRKSSESNHSDAFFAITSYMEVGRGRLLGCFGMLIALSLHAIISHFWHYKRRPALAEVNRSKG